MGGQEILKVSLHSWQRGVNPVILWRSPRILPTPIFQNLTTPIPHFPVTSNPHCSYCCRISLADWLITPHLMCILLNNIDPYMSSLSTLVPEEPWYVFYVTRHQVYWVLTHNVVFYWYSNLISHTHKHKNTQRTQGPVDWHTHI